MNYQSHNSRPQNASDNCPYCHGTGFRNVRFGPQQQYTGMARCECKKAMDAERPAGFEKAGAALSSGGFRPPHGEINSPLHAVLSDTDRKIARLIEERMGKENAIRIDEIAGQIWTEEWMGIDANFQTVCSGRELDKQQDGLRRSVKATVEKLRMLARMPIAATKRPPYGYYIPVTAEECDECYKRLFGEGVKLIQLSRLFKPDANLVEELRGQLKF